MKTDFFFRKKETMLVEKTTRVKMGKRKRDKKINYFKLNKGTWLLSGGIILLIILLLLIHFIGAISILINLRFVSYILIYLGLIIHLILVGDKPFTKSKNYIKESRNFIYSIIGIFVIFTLVGFFVPLPESVTEKILKFIQDIFEKTQGMNQVELTKFIFLNNLKSSFLGMVLGFILGIYPILVAVVNGGLLGFVASFSVAEEGFGVLWRLFPHGIFELPAVFISLGLGLKLGTFIFKKNKLKSFEEYFWNSLRVFLFFILPLLVLAAIIEGILVFYFG